MANDDDDDDDDDDDAAIEDAVVAVDVIANRLLDRLARKRKRGEGVYLNSVLPASFELRLRSDDKPHCFTLLSRFEELLKKTPATKRPREVSAEEDRENKR